MAGRVFAAGRAAPGNGRPPAGERWAFTSLAHQFRMRRGESLEYLERYRLIPEEGRLDSRWSGDISSFFGTTLASGPPSARRRAERLQAELCAIPDVRAAADALSERLVLVRIQEAGSRHARITEADGARCFASRFTAKNQRVHERTRFSAHGQIQLIIERGLIASQCNLIAVDIDCV